MQFYVHHIHNPVLKPYVQYILFNKIEKESTVTEITSYANTNICLGILLGSEMVVKKDGSKTLVKKSKLTSYISGLYTSPHILVHTEAQDEICIDFTPLGYYHFFPFAVKKYILNEDVLTEAFGKTSHVYFENVFQAPGFSERGLLIESFLVSKLKKFENAFMSESLQLIHNSNGEIGIGDWTKKLNSNEKKLYRQYIQYFDLSPQDYKRIVRFRYALKNLSRYKKQLTKLSYKCEYYDQSHFIKEIKKFTELTPRQCASQCIRINDTVVMNVR